MGICLVYTLWYMGGIHPGIHPVVYGRYTHPGYTLLPTHPGYTPLPAHCWSPYYTPGVHTAVSGNEALGSNP